MKIGKRVRLRLSHKNKSGYWFGEGQPEDQVFVPGNMAPEDWNEGDSTMLFVYRDPQRRLIGSTQEPLIEIGEFARLKCAAVSRVGAFLDMGIEKDLFVPFREQQPRMDVGKSYLVTMYLDPETDRLVGSSRLGRFLQDHSGELSEGDEVGLLVHRITDLGANVIVNHKYPGLVYHTEVFRKLRVGDRLTGFVKAVRPDGRLDISLQEQGYSEVETQAQRILDRLRAEKGYLPLTDKSLPGEIYDTFGISKKNFKKAVGKLYKERRIEIEEKGIRLTE